MLKAVKGAILRQKAIQVSKTERKELLEGIIENDIEFINPSR